jgi:hypothetical protein
MSKLLVVTSIAFLVICLFENKWPLIYWQNIHWQELLPPRIAVKEARVLIMQPSPGQTMAAETH